jgi:sec-independent protein translocase protein TatA
MRLQFWHLIVLLLVVLLLFGANRLPDLARSVGKSMKIFKSELKDLRDEPAAEPPAAPPSTAPQGEAPTSPASPTNPDPAPADPRPKDR